MIVSEVQAPAGMTAAANFPSAVGGGTIPAASTPPPVLAAASLSAADPSASSASHILAQFEIGGWSAAGTKDDAEGQQIGGIDASHEEENGNLKLTPTPGPAAGLSASDAKAGAIRGRLLPFGWLFSLVLQAARACWVRMVVPAASWLWLAVTTSPASPAAAAAVPAHQHLKPLPTLHHLTVHESRNPLLPPGLLYLATLTLVALVIHPDGYTWVVLRRIREFVAITVRATAALWSLVLEDYGAVVSSILALATFAALFFLAYVLRRTLAPKAHPGAGSGSSKQKHVVRKKRSGRGNQQHQQQHHHHGVQHGRRGQQQHRGVGGRAQSHVDDHSASSRDEPGTLSLSGHALPALLEDVPLSPPPLQSTRRPAAPVAAATADDDGCIKAGSGHSLSSSGAASSKVSSRERVMTEDTDDLSYDSVSGRSTPTMAVDLSSQHSASSSSVNLAASPITSRQQSRRDAAIPRTMSVPTPAKGGARKEAVGRRKKPEPSPTPRVSVPPPAAVKPARTTSAATGSSATPNSLAASAQSQGRWESLKPRGKGQQHQQQLASQLQAQSQQQSRQQPRSRHPAPVTTQVQHPRPVTGKQPRTSDHTNVRSPKPAPRDATTSGSTASAKQTKNPATTAPSQTPPSASAESRGAHLVVSTAQESSPTPTVFYSPSRDAASTPALGESSATPFGTPLSISSAQQSSFFSTSAWDPKPATLSSSSCPWAATDAATASTASSIGHGLQATALDFGIGLGEITLGAPAASVFGRPAPSFASIRPPPGLSLPPSFAVNQHNEPSLSSVLPGLAATSVPAIDDSVSTALFPVTTTPAPGTAAVYSPRRRVRENPFEDETTARDDDGDDDLMIEAELRELGGRIAGSVLDS